MILKKGKFLLVFVMGVILLVLGCSKTEENQEAAGEIKSDLPKFIFEEKVFPPSPKGQIKLADQIYDMKAGGFEWTNGEEHIQTDALSPVQIADTMEAIKVKPASHVQIEIEQNPNLHLYRWEGEEKVTPVQLQGNEVEIPLEKGPMIYEVRAEWENGKLSYTFVVEVESGEM